MVIRTLPHLRKNLSRQLSGEMKYAVNISGTIPLLRGIKLSGRQERYEMSCIPPDARGIAFGCEFEPMLRDTNYSRDYSSLSKMISMT